MSSSIILYVPQPDDCSSVKAGGQYTAALGLINYLNEVNREYEVFNTTPLSANQSKLSKVLCAYRRFKAVYTRSRSADVVILAFTGSFFSLTERFFLSVLIQRKLALSFRNSETLDIEPRSIKGRLISVFFKRVTVIFVQGIKLKEHLSLFGIDPSRIVVIPNWLPVNYAVAQEPVKISHKDTVRIVMVARIVRAKGVFELIDAISEIVSLEFRWDFQVDIIGGGEDLDEVHEYCVSLGLSKLINFHGWKSSEQINSILKQSHIFVLPSYNEGFPNSILEALAIGLPIISTDVGAISESVIDGENGFIVELRDVHSLANAIIRYLQNPSLIEQHSKSSLSVATRRHNRSINCKVMVDRLV